jgi:hypothetical protein
MVKVNQKKKTNFLTTASQYQVYHKTITLLLFNHIFPECVKYSNDFFFEWNRRRLQAAITGFAAASFTIPWWICSAKMTSLGTKAAFSIPKTNLFQLQAALFHSSPVLERKRRNFCDAVSVSPYLFLFICAYVYGMDSLIFFFKFGFFLIYIFCVVFSAFDELGYSF